MSRVQRINRSLPGSPATSKDVPVPSTIVPRFRSTIRNRRFSSACCTLQPCRRIHLGRLKSPNKKPQRVYNNTLVRPIFEWATNREITSHILRPRQALCDFVQPRQKHVVVFLNCVDRLPSVASDLRILVHKLCNIGHDGPLVRSIHVDVLNKTNVNRNRSVWYLQNKKIVR